MPIAAHTRIWYKFKNSSSEFEFVMASKHAKFRYHCNYSKRYTFEEKLHAVAVVVPTTAATRLPVIPVGNNLSFFHLHKYKQTTSGICPFIHIHVDTINGITSDGTAVLHLA